MTRARSGPYVSRGGEKLAAALDHFALDVAGCRCADLGSQIGGFVDCLLQRGAARVFAVDTCYGTLAWTLRRNPRVVVMERTNAMHVSLPEPVDLVTIDVGWTPQMQVLPNVVRLIGSIPAAATQWSEGDDTTRQRRDKATRQRGDGGAAERGHSGGRVIDPTAPGVDSTRRESESERGCIPQRPHRASSRHSDLDHPTCQDLRKPGGHVVTLIKPHYEARRLAQTGGHADGDDETGSARQRAGVPGLAHGVLTDEAFEKVVAAVLAEIETAGWRVKSSFESPIRGHAGNREVFALLKRSGPA